MNIGNTIIKVIEKIRVIKGVKIEIIETDTVITEDILLEIEAKLKYTFPISLRKFYLNEYSAFKLKWFASPSTFNDDCTMGELNIINPNLILKKYQDMQYEVEQALMDKEQLNYDEGLKAIVDDWLYWIPIIVFSNGDAFCIDKRDKTYPIVFLEHDVMDAGPNLHGLKIAKNIDDLIIKWSRSGFTDVYDWYDVVNDNGIDLTSEVFKQVLSKLEL